MSLIRGDGAKRA